MGKDSPSAPNVLGAAEETGEQAFRLNEAQTGANRPNQTNAWGGTQWTSAPVWNPTTGRYQTAWNQSETLNPTLQSALDAQQNVQAGRSNLAQAQMARVWDDFSNPMDFDQYGQPVGMQNAGQTQDFSYNPLEAGGAGAPERFGYDALNFNVGGQRQAAEDAAYQRSTSRLDPQYEQRESQLVDRLRSQGLRQGDQAYDAAISNLGRERTDAYEQARLGATTEGRAEAQQFFGQTLGAQGQQYQQALGANQANNAAQQAQFGQTLGAQGQQYQQALGANQINNALQQQRFGQGVQESQIANALRSQSIQEGLYQQDYNLNRLNQLLAGQQIAGGPPSTGGETETIVEQTLGGG